MLRKHVVAASVGACRATRAAPGECVVEFGRRMFNFDIGDPSVEAHPLRRAWRQSRRALRGPLT